MLKRTCRQGVCLWETASHTLLFSWKGAPEIQRFQQVIAVMLSQKPPAAGFERRPSAEGKQIKWAQDTNFGFERRPSDNSFACAIDSEREVDQALELLGPDHIGSKCTDVFLRTASGCCTTTSSSATAKSCRATAMELLFPDEEPAARFSRDESTKSNAMPRIRTLATASSPCRPFTECSPFRENPITRNLELTQPDKRGVGNQIFWNYARFFEYTGTNAFSRIQKVPSSDEVPPG